MITDDKLSGYAKRVARRFTVLPPRSGVDYREGYVDGLLHLGTQLQRRKVIKAGLRVLRECNFGVAWHSDEASEYEALWEAVLTMLQEIAEGAE